MSVKADVPVTERNYIVSAKNGLFVKRKRVASDKKITFGEAELIYLFIFC